MIILDFNNWKSMVNNSIKAYFEKFLVFDESRNTLDDAKLKQYISVLRKDDADTAILNYLYTGNYEYIQGAGNCPISLYNYFSDELENLLIDEFYRLNKDTFGEDLENFTDYFCSEHTALLKTYIYDVLDHYTPEKLAELVLS